MTVNHLAPVEEPVLGNFFIFHGNLGQLQSWKKHEEKKGANRPLAEVCAHDRIL